MIALPPARSEGRPWADAEPYDLKLTSDIAVQLPDPTMSKDPVSSKVPLPLTDFELGPIVSVPDPLMVTRSPLLATATSGHAAMLHSVQTPEAKPRTTQSPEGRVGDALPAVQMKDWVPLVAKAVPANDRVRSMVVPAIST